MRMNGGEKDRVVAWERRGTGVGHLMPLCATNSIRFSTEAQCHLVLKDDL
jgi:hypothetical protein